MPVRRTEILLPQLLVDAQWRIECVGHHSRGLDGPQAWAGVQHIHSIDFAFQAVSQTPCLRSAAFGQPPATQRATDHVVHVTPRFRVPDENQFPARHHVAAFARSAVPNIPMHSKGINTKAI